MRHRSVERAILEGIRNEAEELDKVVPETPDDTGGGFAPDANMTIKDGDDLPPEPEERGGLPEAVIEVMAAGKARKAGLKPEDVDQGELEMGLEVEKEHTDDPRVAEMIALDHLEEIPDYYTRLKRMEDEAKAGMGKKEPPKPEEPEDDEDEGPEDDED